MRFPAGMGNMSSGYPGEVKGEPEIGHPASARFRVSLGHRHGSVSSGAYSDRQFLTVDNIKIPLPDGSGLNRRCI